MIIQGNIVDVVAKEIYPGRIFFEAGKITRIERNLNTTYDQFILPGFIDAHVHIESSMLVPSEFARLAVVHGTVGTVSDPHEIANVLGVPVSTFFGAHDATTIARSDRGTALSPLKLLTVPGALRVLRAYGQLNDGKMRRSILELVENIAAGRR